MGKRHSCTLQAGNTIYNFDNNPCDYFEGGNGKAAMLSLSALVSIEMFIALNALSEGGSLVTMPLWVNPYLLAAMLVSFGLHYAPFFPICLRLSLCRSMSGCSSSRSRFLSFSSMKS
eukprot:TRINITY_DN3194_c0_g1_i3.p4 TRINITY_DN3194_c0_g1~~TRINITY_DN3194_c0_g1_i3.p4  ORF type:complete len:117 (-),score=7.42 TRINITY_DN3194_c0_g1_i3:364-714(-)